MNTRQKQLLHGCRCRNPIKENDMSEEHAIDMAVEIVKRGGRDEE